MFSMVLSSCSLVMTATTVVVRVTSIGPPALDRTFKFCGLQLLAFGTAAIALWISGRASAGVAYRRHDKRAFSLAVLALWLSVPATCCSCF